MSLLDQYSVLVWTCYLTESRTRSFAGVTFGHMIVTNLCFATESAIINVESLESFVVK